MESTRKTHETVFYFCLWTVAVFYSIHSFCQQSLKYFSNYQDDYNDFEPGIFANSHKDIADLEWQTILYLFKRIWIWIIIQLIISVKLKHHCNYQVLQMCRVALSITFILVYLGPLPLFAVLAQPILLRIIFSLNTERIGLWISNIVFIFLISVYKYYVSSELFMSRFKLNDKENYLHILAIYWTNLRCFSFFMEKGIKKEKESLLNLLSYCLYLPLLFNGPFIFYSDFKKNEIVDTSYQERFLFMLGNITRFIFWMIIIELFLHLIYVNATSFQMQLVESLDDWALYGYGYSMGQYFHMKYLVIYGLSTSIAKFEGIPVPSLPKCIGRIHLYSDMWKYFDNGLYKFLLRFIYIPMMESSYMNNKILASFACFSFIYIWHGLDSYIFVWVVLNFIGIVIENSSSAFNEAHLKGSKIEQFLGIFWMRRIKCFLASFLLAISAISNFFFFSSVSIGTIFVRRILEASFMSNMTLILALYCCCQVSVELENGMTKKAY